MHIYIVLSTIFIKIWFGLIYKNEIKKYKVNLSNKNFYRSNDYLKNLIKPLTNKEIDRVKKLE